MKYRQKIISDYMLMGPAKFVDYYLQNDKQDSIIVIFDTENAVAPTTGIINNLILEKAPNLPFERLSDHDELFFAPIWIILIFDYLEHKNSDNRDKYIWID